MVLVKKYHQKRYVAHKIHYDYHYPTSTDLFPFIKARGLGRMARISLKALATLTHCCVDPDDLHEIGNKIQDIITFLKDRLQL